MPLLDKRSKDSMGASSMAPLKRLPCGTGHILLLKIRGIVLSDLATEQTHNHTCLWMALTDIQPPRDAPNRNTGL